MSEPKPKSDAQPVTFNAPRELVAKLDALAERELMSRATLLRRLASQATQAAA